MEAAQLKIATPDPLLKHNGRDPIIVDRATPAYRALMLEIERMRQAVGWPCWQLEEVAGLNDGHYQHLLHADRPHGRQGSWKMIQLLVEALFPAGFDLVLMPKRGGALTAESHALKVKFAQADHNRQTRRELMRELGKRGAAARKLKLTEKQIKKIARNASKVAAIKRSKEAAARAKGECPAPHLSAPPCVGNDQSPPAECS
ncbi:hypothetical protein V1279_007143 [Bradyrhizobium sp. AZCC 1610]|uniref:hypothetical protein n=1 Tax=Bradyrhizobium sp. AZCC 1610 TaxID=3117020 RepID=UPI002FF124D8